MAEDFSAQPRSPQVARLDGIRQSAAIILLIGERYGQKQPDSGLSPTHEEFEEAKNTRPVFVFVQEGITREPDEAAFADTVQGWAGGYFRSVFRTPEELRTLVTQAIHKWEVSSAAAPINADALSAKAMQLVPRENRNYGGRERCLGLAIVSGPEQMILRPSKLEDADLADWLRREALLEIPDL